MSSAKVGRLSSPTFGVIEQSPAYLEREQRVPPGGVHDLAQALTRDRADRAVRTATGATAPNDSGPTCSRSTTALDRTASKLPTGPGRRAKRKMTRPSWSRRARKATASADGPSSHCRSSIATTTGARAARARTSSQQSKRDELRRSWAPGRARSAKAPLRGHGAAQSAGSRGRPRRVGRTGRSDQRTGAVRRLHPAAPPAHGLLCPERQTRRPPIAWSCRYRVSPIKTIEAPRRRLAHEIIETRELRLATDNRQSRPD